MAHIAVLPLVGSQISQPFREEFFGIIVQACGAHKYLGVSGPAEAFIPLRAVGRDVDKIPLLPPDDVVKETV